MGLATDMTFRILSSVSNDFHVFATSVGCEDTYIGSTELNNVPYISSKVTCTINISDKETWMLRLKIWMLWMISNLKKPCLR